MQRGFADLDFRVDSSESGREAQARGLSVLREALDSPYELPALVSHGQLMTHLLSNIDVSFGFEAWRSLSNPDVYLVEQSADGVLSFGRLWQSV
jgi:2,3-bisphosphoglycerate-dependent phosphoglycerate mutase